MRVSGTAPDYQGLYACARAASVLSADVIDAVPANFPEIALPAGLVKSMVEIDDASEHLKAIEKAAWTVPPDHPDLVPVAEAGRMADMLRVLESNERVIVKPAEFRTLLKHAAAEAQKLEDMLASGDRDASKLTGQFKVVGASCTDCHTKYRD